jgi:CRP/FNR family cyclic AMP-dependent transcriptional regulator
VADDLTTLRSLPLFEGLGDDVLRRVLDVATEVDIPAGQALAKAGDPGTGMFVIVAGSVVVEARDQKVVDLGPGEFVGELALFVPESTRVARVRAKTDVRCLAISRLDFEQLLADEPRIAVAMLPVLARRLWRVRQGG